MIDFNKISVNQIVHISQVINESSLFQEEFIKARYSRTMPNYQTTVEFLRMLNLVANKGHHVSERNFKKIQNMKEKIGRAAEEAVLEYEKARLSKFPHVADKIEHIAIKDVSAGYDIKSYERHAEGGFTPRLIEVKAVSSWDYHFYWTKNEIETSRLNGTDYYLYLLPVYTKNEFDLKNMKQIKDPFTNVYNNNKMWTPTIETISYAFSNEPKMTKAFDES